MFSGNGPGIWGRGLRDKGLRVEEKVRDLVGIGILLF